MKNYKSFIKVYNNLFYYKLSSSAFVVYLYLSDISHHTGSAKVRYETIADKCNISPKTAYKAINELISCELIEKQNRYNDNYYFATNLYTVKHLKGGYSKLDRRVFQLASDSGLLYVLCAINKFANHCNLAFPSYNKLADETGLSRTTVIRKVKQLQEMCLIAKELRHSEVFFDYISNTYAVIKIELRVFLLALVLKLKQMIKSIAGKDSDNAFIFLMKYIIRLENYIGIQAITTLSYITSQQRLNL